MCDSAISLSDLLIDNKLKCRGVQVDKYEKGNFCSSSNKTTFKRCYILFYVYYTFYIKINN